jgi:hypothetical protein
MNDKVYDLIVKILDSDLSKESKDEIVRFYTLPRNTPVQPMIELPEDDEGLGTIHRPTAKDEQRKLNPRKAQEEDAMSDTLKGRV